MILYNRKICCSPSCDFTRGLILIDDRLKVRLLGRLQLFLFSFVDKSFVTIIIIIILFCKDELVC